MLANLRIRLEALVHRRRMDAELDEELRCHLDREIERNVANGMSRDDAIALARRAFGNTSVVTDEARDTMRWRTLEELGQDVSYAMRTFARAPTFVITVVATIGLGLGLLSTAFTIFDSYVLRPNAVRDPNSLYDVSWHDNQGRWNTLTWSQFQTLAARHDVFTESYADMNLQIRLRGTPAIGQLVSGNYFDVLGGTAVLGRTLRHEDSATPGISPVVVISHDTWESMFGGDPGIVGRAVSLNGVPLRIVGVAREGFSGIESVPLQFWAPITMAGRLDPERNPFAAKPSSAVRMVGRLRPGVSSTQAAAAVLASLATATAELPRPHRARDVNLESRATSVPITTDAVDAFLPLAMAFVLVMLIACANVANVMLARGMARQREIGIRLALGAARPRLVRQLLTESVLLSVPSAMAGYLVSRLTITLCLHLIVALAPPAYRAYIRPMPLTADTRVVIFVLLAAVGSAVLFGLVPALQATRPGIVHATRGDFDSHLRPSRLRTILVVSQIAVSALLLICTGVLLRTAQAAGRREFGVRIHNIVVLHLVDHGLSRALDELRTIPGVKQLASASSSPVDGIFRDIRAGTTEAPNEAIKYNLVSSGYFDVMNLPIRAGRTFTADEARGRSPIAIVSVATAERLWPGQSPIGRHIVLAQTVARDGPLARYRDATVIGVVPNARPGWIGISPEVPVVYYPQPLDTQGSSVMAQTATDANDGLAAIEHALEANDSTAIGEAHTLDDALAVQLYPFDMAYWTAALIGGIALLLTLTGVYGVLAYIVAQRTREFGVRLALGANPFELIALVLRHIARLAFVGLAFSLVAALLAARLMSSISYVVDIYDVRGYLLGLGVVLGSCLFAAYMPARRAGSVDPVQALRADS